MSLGRFVLSDIISGICVKVSVRVFQVINNFHIHIHHLYNINIYGAHYRNFSPDTQHIVHYTNHLVNLREAIPKARNRWTATRKEVSIVCVTLEIM